MLPVACLIVLAAFAQILPEEEGLSPYIFKMRGEDEFLYALVDEEELDDVAIDVLVDAPWLPLEERYRQLQRTMVVSYEREEPASRRGRLERGWRAHGGVEAQTPNGTLWVLQSEFELAERARTMARTALPERRDEIPATAALGEAQDSAENAPGFWALWAPHIAVAAAGLAALAGLGVIMARS